MFPASSTFVGNPPDGRPWGRFVAVGSPRGAEIPRDCIGEIPERHLTGQLYRCSFVGVEGIDGYFPNRLSVL